MNNDQLYFCENCADGTSWSYVGTLDQILTELSSDTELSKDDLLDWMRSSEVSVKENEGHVTTKLYHINGEQWYSSIYAITTKINQRGEDDR